MSHDIPVASISSVLPRCYFRLKRKKRGFIRSQCECQNVATQVVEVNGLAVKLCDVHADATVKKRFKVVIRNRRIQFQELKAA